MTTLAGILFVAAMALFGGTVAVSIGNHRIRREVVRNLDKAGRLQTQIQRELRYLLEVKHTIDKQLRRAEGEGWKHPKDD